jgi:hypothetical protein
MAHAEPPCRPFRIYLDAPLPPEPPADSEAANDLAKCIAYYSQFKHRGIPDWTSKVDGQTSEVLYPNNPDWDGDGTPNVLDPAPFDAGISQARLAKNGVPVHLMLKNPEAAKVQGRLWRDFKIMAIDHTDSHSAEVLKAVELVLRNGLSFDVRTHLKSVRYIYAFQGHDPSFNIAAYHRQMNALSIGGVSAYGNSHVPLDRATRIGVLAAIAHELGHAYIFDQMSPRQLTEIGARFGQWRTSADTQPAPRDFLDEVLFREHPLHHLAQLAGRDPINGLQFINSKLWRDVNLTSEYATTNIHEWFADAFAAAILQRLGEKGDLSGVHLASTARALTLSCRRLLGKLQQHLRHISRLANGG